MSCRPTHGWANTVPFDDRSYRHSEGIARATAGTMPEGEKMHSLAWREGRVFFCRPAGLRISGERKCG